jgi:signal transduction histidine kinase
MIHPQRDTLYDLVVKLKDIYHELFLAKNILFTTSNLKEVEHVRLPMEYRRQLYLLLKEAMNNCIKHSHCTKVSLMLSLHKKEFKFVLSDNGQGIDGIGRQEGHGLKNMYRRAALIGGELIIQSDKGTGTVISLVGKLNKRKRKMTGG